MAVYSQSRKDVNSSSILCGVSDLDGSVMPLLIDPVTGRLLVVVTNVTNNSPIISDQIAKKDVNGSPTLLGVSDADGLLVPAIYNVTSQVFLDLLSE